MIPAIITHHTSSYLRFKTSQLPSLPPASVDIELVLPSGFIVPAHFNRNQANPNVTGRELRGYNKKRLPWKGTELVMVDVNLHAPWVMYLMKGAGSVLKKAGLSKSKAAKILAGSLGLGDLTKLLKMADAEATAGKRVAAYNRILRPQGLRQMVLNLVGAKCQIKGCKACADVSAEWGTHAARAIVEVHHIEELARVIDHHPRNLCVLCANHHKLIHAIKDWSTSHDGPDVVLKSGGKKLRIVRPAAMFEVKGV